VASSSIATPPLQLIDARIADAESVSVRVRKTSSSAAAAAAGAVDEEERVLRSCAAQTDVSDEQLIGALAHALRIDAGVRERVLTLLRDDEEEEDDDALARAC
jgi:hypothetical protein